MSVEKLVEHFSVIADPRCAGKVAHRLTDILVIAVCAVIACAESWDDIQGQRMIGPRSSDGKTLHAQSKLTRPPRKTKAGSHATDTWSHGRLNSRWRGVIILSVGKPSFMRRPWDDIALYGRSKLSWLRTFLSLANGIPSHDTFRRVFMRIDPDAFEACFTTWAQSFADAFEREVVAIDGKTLRRSFDRGRAQGPLHLVSAWASEQGLVLGQRAVDGKSNEVTAIPALLETLLLNNSIVTLDAMGCQKTIAGRVLDRGGDYLLVLKANHGKAFTAVQEYCEQHGFAAGAAGKPVFDSFIENGLHWVLDVTFREDDSRVRDRIAARNLAILRKIALNLMSRERTAHVIMRARRKQAAWNDNYMLSLLAG